MRIKAVTVLAALILVAGVSRAGATSYFILPPCAAFSSADVVFVGTIPVTSPRDGTPRTFADRVIAREREERTPTQPQRMTFKVVERLRGEIHGSAEVENNSGVLWAEGETMLVYAKRDQATNRLRVGIASRTKPVESAAGELVQLRRLTKIKSSERLVMGTVRDSGADYQLVPGIQLRLICERDQYLATSGRNGEFDFRVKQGSRSCELRPVLPDSHHMEFASEIAFVEPRTCADAELQIRDNGRIAGIVLSATGTPVGGVTIDAWPAPRTLHRVQGALASVQTGSDGRFEAARLPPGSYVLGISSRTDIAERFSFGTPTYFPGVPAPDAAAVIDVRKGERVALTTTFVLPLDLSFAPVSGVVLLSDGRPAAAAHVAVLSGLNRTGGNYLPITTLTTDSSGRFTARLPAGARYWLSMLWPGDQPPTFDRAKEEVAETEDLLVEERNADLRIVLHRRVQQ